MRKGKVYIIGAGPGDWELISVKGLSRLKEAEVILYDFLASRKLLSFAKRGAEIICVGKADGLHILEQEEINKLLDKKARQGKIVARLKGGDPLLFSRGIEEALYLQKRGIPFEIIPGITSAFAAPESFGVPLTKRGTISSVAVIAGRRSDGKPIEAPACGTLIYLMAVGNIKNVVNAILKSGKNKTTSCAFIERGTTDKERIITGTLGTIVRKTNQRALRAPAVLVVGEVVKYGKRLYADKYTSS
ncbi:MAG: uroporphyrinogen-III C-methyltransferase [Candidatus Omnitrophota bacterium]|nr:uroporphyrinogen-III C-methyltransferase [Candidatus Omnitrophota bacterium]